MYDVAITASSYHFQFARAGRLLEEPKMAAVPLDFAGSVGRRVTLQGEPRQVATDSGPPLW
jgi:hypothetical protein